MKHNIDSQLPPFWLANYVYMNLLFSSLIGYIYNLKRKNFRKKVGFACITELTLTVLQCNTIIFSAQQVGLT